MTKTHIQQTMASLVTDLAEHPEKCLAADTPATATIEAGLRCHATGPRGAALTTDMPVGIGGGGSGPSPGWYLRAALATCDATVIAMRAAQLGVVLTTLEVTVESESGSSGLLGMDGGITPGPLSIRTRVHIAADGVPSEQLRALVTWAEERSPVADALRRAVPVTTSVEIHDYPDLW